MDAATDSAADGGALLDASTEGATDAASAGDGDASTDVLSTPPDTDATDASVDSLLSDDAPSFDEAEASPLDAPPEATPYDGPTGSPDPTFGNAGMAAAPFPEDGGSFGQLTSLALDPDAGTLTVGGTALHADQTTWAAGVARFTSGGNPDTSFASTGVLVTDFGLSTQPVVGGLALEPDRSTLVAGFGYASLTANSFYVARLTRAGALDTTFASSGLLSTSPPSGSFDGAYPLSIDATGFYVGGWEGTGSASDFALWRFDMSAAPVSSFGTAGKVKTAIDGTNPAHATAMARQSSGRVLLAGYAMDPASYAYDAAVARYTAAGALDATFGTGGIALAGQVSSAEASAIAVQPDDKVIVAGYTTPSNDSEITVWRLTPDGALDTTFGSGGLVVESFAQLGGRAAGVALQADGRIVVVGDVFPLGRTNMFVMRLLPDGSLDPDFAGAGVVVSSSDTPDHANAVAIQPDGAILVAGTSNYGGIALWRYR